MIHTSTRGIAQLGFHIAEEEVAAVSVPQLSFSGYILHRTQGFQWGLRGSQSRVWKNMFRINYFIYYKKYNVVCLFL